MMSFKAVLVLVAAVSLASGQSNGIQMPATVPQPNGCVKRLPFFRP